MTAAFEPPIQSPPDARIPVSQLAATAAPSAEPAEPAPTPAPAPAPKRKPLASSAGPRTRLASATQPGRTDDGLGPAGDTTTTANSTGSLRELKLRRGQPDAERQTGVRGFVGRPKIRNPPQASAASASKPLLPVSERKSQEENKFDRLAKKDKDAADGDKWDIAPDGSSAGRDGRQFTVSNVGNNGRIYLRPTIRPAHLRFPQPNFVFPITPPATTDRERRGDNIQRRPSQSQVPQRSTQHTQSHEQGAPHLPPPPIRESHVLSGSDWTADPLPSPTANSLTSPRFTSRNTTRSPNGNRPATAAGALGGRSAAAHRRAVSDSTMQDTSIARESEPGGFKIVISQPHEDALRSRTVEDLHHAKAGPSTPHLEITIPSWKIGTPGFTMRGTPTFQGSSNANTDDPQSSRPSYFGTTGVLAHSQDDGLVSPRQNLFRQQKRNERSLPTPLASPGFALNSPARGMSLMYHSTYIAVEPSMFDALTFKPACDDRLIVRYAPGTESITAATPPRLVAEITSPTFMDYDLVSDFFLTYRAFLDPHDLLRMLVARLRWAIARDDETGMVVRVRTFVAMRHWILNYFIDDFVVDYPLRILFCTLLNSFVDELSNSPKGRKVQLKILTELKKCWRRSCAQFWDGEDTDDALGPEVPIEPGGIAGHRNPALDPSFWEDIAAGESPQEDDDNGSTFLTHLQSPESMVGPEPGSSLTAAGGRTGHIDSVIMGGRRPATPETQIRSSEATTERHHASPVSISSLDFVSCSFPTKSMRMLQASMGDSVGAHPAEPQLTYNSSGMVAMTPRALVGKRVRASDSKASTTRSQTHNRNTSLSASIKEHASAAERVLQSNTELLMSLPFAGDLVRGNIFPPGQPYVEILPPGTSGGFNRQTTFFDSVPTESVDSSHKEKATAMSGQGMMKLLGSVRRALSTRGQGGSPAAMGGSFINIPPPGPRDATTNRLPGTAIVPQARSRMDGFRTPVRIDLLGAKVAEDFKAAVSEDDAPEEAEAQPEEEEETAPAPTPAFQELGLNLPEYRNMAATSDYSDSIFLGWIPGRGKGDFRPTSDAGLTAGSKSIVIMDGTLSSNLPNLPAMSGALPEHNPSVEMFGDAFLSVAADPTPPTTPPGVPRRSSYLLGHSPAPPSLSIDPLPPFIPDWDTLRANSVAAEPRASLADQFMRPSSEVLADADEPASDTLPELPELAPGAEETANGSIARSSMTKKIPDTNSFGMPSSPPVRMHRPSWAYGHSRHQSSRSQRSNRLYGLRRTASFSSAMSPRSDVRSLDASTFDDGLFGELKEDEMAQPMHMLRRKPGGDLRAATMMADVDYRRLRRSQSVDSFGTYSESMCSSFRPSRPRGSNGFVDVISVDYTLEKADEKDEDEDEDKEKTFSVGMITDKKPNHRLSLYSMHTSRPIMRPSFEAEAQKLAQIPDDEEGGGVEQALLKLEGKYKPKPKKLTFADPSGATGGPSSPSAGKPGGLPVLSVFSPRKAARDSRMLADGGPSYRHRSGGGRDLSPTKQPEPSKLGQFSYAAADAADDTDESQAGLDSSGNSVGGAMAPSVSLAPPPAAVSRMFDGSRSFLTENSGESYLSLPLLERDMTDDGRSKGDWGGHSVLEDANTSGQQTPTPSAVPEPEQQMETIDGIPQHHLGDTMPTSPAQATEVSFFDNDDDDDSDHASDLSSELSAEDEERPDLYSEAVRGLADTNGARSRRAGQPRRISIEEQHPGRLVEDLPLGSHPPSPPMTLVQALRMSPDTAKIPEVHDSQLWGDDKALPRMGGSAAAQKQRQHEEAAVLESIGMQPMAKQAAKQQATKQQATTVQEPPRTAAGLEAARTFSVHLPFILAFESETLAQQFTLIEKDALHEIDWKELIDMRWKHAENSDVRSWVDFLRNTEARGVEVVIARFNIMVKWAISEVILTQDVAERAQCVIKLIHIAAHCRRYRNYATMSQLALALSSNEVARLGQTWALVPGRDMATLRELEALVLPTRNFRSLRAEMEAVDIDNAESGCIPFVGIYTHDLIFNAQRPSEIASSPTTAPLVNFERCRIAASIVKTLLRLVEASALYSFQPIEGITERCLWMSALSDDDIRKYSEMLE